MLRSFNFRTYFLKVTIIFVEIVNFAVTNSGAVIRSIYNYTMPKINKGGFFKGFLNVFYPVTDRLRTIYVSHRDRVTDRLRTMQMC